MRIASHDLRNPLCLILVSASWRPQGAAGGNQYLQASTPPPQYGIIDTFLSAEAGPDHRGPPGRVDLNLLAAAIVAQHGPPRAQTEPSSSS